MPKVAWPAANSADGVDADSIVEDTRSMHKLMSYPDPRNISRFVLRLLISSWDIHAELCLEVSWAAIAIALGMRLSRWVDEQKGSAVGGDGVKQLSCSLGFDNDERLIWKIFAACGKSERNFSFTCSCCCLALLCSPMITKLSFTWGIGACHFLLMAPLSEPEFFQN